VSFAQDRLKQLHRIPGAILENHWRQPRYPRLKRPPDAPQTEELAQLPGRVAPAEGERLSVEQRATKSHAGGISKCETVFGGHDFTRTIRKFGRLSGSIVVPKEPTEPRATADAATRWPGRRRHNQPVLQALVIPLPVIVHGEGDERATEMRLA
jgi:hypothetical protein